MQLVRALDAIFRLIVSWKSFYYFVDTTWHIPTNCRREGNNISDLEFMGRHRLIALVLLSQNVAGKFDSESGTWTDSRSASRTRSRCHSRVMRREVPTQ